MINKKEHDRHIIRHENVCLAYNDRWWVLTLGAIRPQKMASSEH